MEKLPTPSCPQRSLDLIFFSLVRSLLLTISYMLWEVPRINTGCSSVWQHLPLITGGELKKENNLSLVSL